jgi:hypothetical protein
MYRKITLYQIDWPLSISSRPSGQRTVCRIREAHLNRTHHTGKTYASALSHGQVANLTLLIGWLGQDNRAWRERRTTDPFHLTAIIQSVM